MAVTIKGIQGVAEAGTYLMAAEGTANTNVTVNTYYTCQYLKVGNVVTVSGAIALTPTAGGAVVANITIPIASTFTAAEQCGGTANTASGVQESACFRAISSGTPRVAMHFLAVDSGTQRDWWFSFTYLIL